MSDEPQPWVTIELDAIEESFTILGFSESEAAAREQFVRAEYSTSYLRAFQVEKHLGRNVMRWMRACGVVTDVAAGTAIQHAELIHKMATGTVTEEQILRKGSSER